MNGSVMFISINPIGKLPRQKKNTAQKLVANGAVLGITVEAENDLRHGGCKERIRERGSDDPCRVQHPPGVCPGGVYPGPIKGFLGESFSGFV